MHWTPTTAGRALTWALLLALAICGEAQAFDFKGLVLGEPITPAEVEARLNTGCKGRDNKPCDSIDSMLYDKGRIRCGEGWEGAQVCNGTTTAAGYPADVNIVIGANGALRRVYLTRLDPDGFDAIRQEITAKFGAPKSTAAPVLRNAFGATFRQAEVTWTDAKRRHVTLSKYAGTTEAGSLLFATPEDRIATERAKKGKTGDL